MAVREFIGARYITKFANPITWSSTRSYEAIEVVQHNGFTYISKCPVPTGVQISNTDYWLLWADPNAQMEQLRQEVESHFPITPSDISDNAITTAKIANGAITSVKESTRYIGIIGDSFSDGANEWTAIVKNHTKYELINKAVAGAAFTKINGNEFVQQLVKIANDANFDKCDKIIVYGGVNDWNDMGASVSQMQNAFDAFLTAYNSLSRKPNLIFAFGNCGYASLARYNGFGKWYRQCVEYLKSINMPGLVTGVPFWLFENSQSSFNSDNLHPNSLGHATIAMRMMQIINGTYTGVQFTKSVMVDRDDTLETAVKGYKIIATFNNGVTNITGRFYYDLSDTTTEQGWVHIIPPTENPLVKSCFEFGWQNENDYEGMELIQTIATRITSSVNNYFRETLAGFNIKNKNIYLRLFKTGTAPTAPTIDCYYLNISAFSTGCC